MSDARLWKNLTVAISTVVDEGSFTADEDGMWLREMDPSHVAMIDFMCPKSLFDEFICDEPTKLCINFSELLRFMRRIGSDESIDLLFDSSDAKLNIVLKSKYTRTFSISTLEPSGDKVPTPKIAFNSKAQMTAKCLKNSVADASTVSDQIQFETKDDKLILKASGNRGVVTIDIDTDSDELLSLDVKQPSQATFSLNYLSDIVKAVSNLTSIVTVEFSTDMPLRLNFELPQKGKLLYYLAPRIESN